MGKKGQHRKTIGSIILQQARAVTAEAVTIRRHIHANPELSNQEYQTARYIYSRLSKYGLAPKYHVGKRGVTAQIKNGPGLKIVLRADIDALPVEEVNRISFKSKRSGVMHACGHDIHTACLLGAVKVLLQLKDTWSGTIVALFQPAEEVEPGGAQWMIQEGAFPDDAAAVFGLHVNADEAVGQVGMREGNDYAGVTIFDVVVRGKGGHGATPERNIDPVVCGADMILALRTISEKYRKRSTPAVVTAGSFHGGTKRNVVPDTVRFEGTMRTFTSSDERNLRKEIKNRLNTIARNHGAKVSVQYGEAYPPGYNNPELHARMRTVFKSILGARKIIDRSEPTRYSEDFAYYQQLVPGLYVHLGVRDPKRRSAPGIHTANFLPDERSIPIGIALHSLFAIEMCSRG